MTGYHGSPDSYSRECGPGARRPSRAGAGGSIPTCHHPRFPPAMIEIVTLLPEGSLEKIRRATGTLSRTHGGSYRIVPVNQWKELRGACVAMPAICVLDPSLTDEGLSLLEALQGELGRIPLVLYSDFRGLSAADLARLGRVVAPSRILTRGVDDDGWRLKATLIATSSAVGRSEALTELFSTFSPGIRRVLFAAMDCAVSGRSVEVLADRLEAKPRTLRRRLRRAGLPPPGELLQWCLLFHASELTGRLGLPVNRVALALGLDSGSNLRRVYRRLLASTPSAVARSGGVEVVAARFRKRLAASA